MLCVVIVSDALVEVAELRFGGLDLLIPIS